MVSNFKIQFSVRLILILLNGFAVVWCISQTELIFTIGLLIVFLIFQIIELFRKIDQSNRDLARLISAIQNQDFVLHFNTKKNNSSFSSLYESFNSLMKVYKEMKIEKEFHYQFLNLIIDQLSTGILIWEKEGDIILLNKNAEKFLQIPNYKTWERLKSKNHILAEIIEGLEPGLGKLLPYKIHEELHQFGFKLDVIYANKKEYYSLIISDLKEEVEQKELEAWQKLITVLTHEVMNSITPVSSLSATMVDLLENNEAEKLSPEDMADLRLALITIQSRSEGILKFVKDYRRLTKVPKPAKTKFSLNDFLSKIFHLYKSEFEQKNIEVQLKVNKKWEIEADEQLLEQVLINLISNAKDVLQNVKNPILKIEITDYNGKIGIQVIDNGPGLPMNVSDKIFIPFFTTKQSGSGIGLSLSRQIMKAHGGNLLLKNSTPGETIFEILI